MDIQKTFELSQPPDAVWDAFADVDLVVGCLPGASIVERLGDDRYKGRFSVKVGPLAAAFDGEVTIERRPQERSGTVAGKGADARSSSRASGTMTYRVAPAEGGRTRVDVDCAINLAGALAQFGKAAVIKEIANRITAEFVKNFETRLAAAAPSAEAAASTPPRDVPLDAGGLVGAILWDRILSFLRFLLGRKARP
jgi:uncharacterized protein